MVSQFEESLKAGGLLLDCNKSQWSHNLAVSFSEVDRQAETIQSLRASYVSDFHDTKRAIKRLNRQIAIAKDNIKERETSTNEFAECMNNLDLADIQATKEELAPFQSKLAELTSLLSQNDAEHLQPDFDIIVAGHPAKYVHPSKAMKVLGSWISGSSKTTIDIDNRITNAWKAFHAQRDRLLNKHVAATVRIKALNVFVAPVLLYGAGSWAATKADLEKVHKTHKQMCA